MKLVTKVVRREGLADHLMLLIHGRGADEHDVEPLLSYLDPAGRFLAVLPRAPLPMPPGYQWYDTIGIPEGGPGFLESVDALDDLLDEASAEHGLARDKAVVAGFSQGAAVALALGLRRSDRPRPAGLLAMSGFLGDVEGLQYDFTDAPPVLIQHGTHDPLIDVHFGRLAAGALAANGVPVVYREYPMGHQVAPESMAEAAAWLDAVIRGMRPADSAQAAEEQAEPEPVDDGPVRSVRTEDFQEEVLQSELPVIVDFWAPWCQPCLMVAPVVEQIALMRDGSYRVVKVNIDEEPMLAQTFGVQSIPMVALFRNGRMERTSLGAKPRPALEAELGMLVIP
jgi:phospholipase/carboxylesterase